MKPATWWGTLVVPVLLVGAVPAVPVPTPSPADSPPACAGDASLVAVLGPHCKRDGGLYEVRLENGDAFATHGPDPLPAGPYDDWLAEPVPPVCVADDVAHVEVLFTHAFDAEDRYADLEDDVRLLVEQANGLLRTSTDAYGRRADLAVACQDGLVAVRHIVLETPRDDEHTGTIVNELIQLGFNRPHVKYWIWHDHQIGTGVSSIRIDDSPGPENANAAGPSYAFTFGHLGAYGALLVLHEGLHTLGAVQNSAPHASGGHHCNDGFDIMCYDDGGPFADYEETACPDAYALDCGGDDYFNPQPAPGQYLADHWNIGGPHNPFFVWDRPALASLACAPYPAQVQQEASCSFASRPDGPAVHYEVRWGDGQVSRVPETGTAPPGLTLTATHAWAEPGPRSVVVTPWSEGEPGAPLRFGAYVHQGPNSPPELAGLSCVPTGTDPYPSASLGVGEEMVCRAEVSDELGSVALRIDWGDGVLSREPALGYAPSGTRLELRHTWTAAGAFPLAAFGEDSADEPAASEPTGVEVVVAHQPVVSPITCGPTPSDPGQIIECSFSATDDGAGVWFEVGFGANPMVRFPTEGSVPPGTSLSASHAFPSSGVHGVYVRAYDLDGHFSNYRVWVQSVRTATPPTTTFMYCGPPGAYAGDVPLGTTAWCAFRSWDPDRYYDPVRVAYTLDWGDGNVTRIPTEGFEPEGATRHAQHLYAGEGDYVVRIGIQDHTGLRGTHLEHALVVRGPCQVNRTGQLAAGLLGQEIEGVTYRIEAGIPPGCRDRYFELRVADVGHDINLCWYRDAERLMCHEAFGGEAGTVPAGANLARVVHYLGGPTTYQLQVFG